MTRFTFAKPAVRRSCISFLMLLGGLLIISPSVSAQTPPPIDGVTGTVAPGATVTQEQVAIHAVIAKTADGVEHLFHYAKALFVHGKKGGDAEQPQARTQSATAGAQDAVAGAGAQSADTAVRTTR